MPHVMPQVALHRVIQDGVKILKQNPDVLDDIFQYYKCEPMEADYGQTYIDQIKQWFITTKIPVVQAWSLNPAQVPQIAIKLATEQEDESKAAMGDFHSDGEEYTVGTAPFTVMLDIALHGTKNSDEVLWLYYIVNYILFKRKLHAEALGLRLQTFSATDYTRDMQPAKSAENVWVRVIRFKTTIQNFWDSDPYLDIGEIDFAVRFESTDETEEPLITQVNVELD